MEYKIAEVKDLLPGEMIDISQQGKSILVTNLNGTYYALGNNCTHLGCFLSKGILEEEKIHCPCLGSVFDVRTGEVLQGPAEEPEPVYENQN